MHAADSSAGLESFKSLDMGAPLEGCHNCGTMDAVDWPSTQRKQSETEGLKNK